jgi:hypothetical protein
VKERVKERIDTRSKRFLFKFVKNVTQFHVKFLFKDLCERNKWI